MQELEEQESNTVKDIETVWGALEVHSKCPGRWKIWLYKIEYINILQYVDYTEYMLHYIYITFKDLADTFIQTDLHLSAISYFRPILPYSDLG